MTKDNKAVILQFSELVTEMNGELNMLRKKVQALEARPDVSAKEYYEMKADYEDCCKDNIYMADGINDILKVLKVEVASNNDVDNLEIIRKHVENLVKYKNANEKKK